MPGGYYDVYVSARERSVAEAVRFLAAFAPSGEQSASEYTFPEYSEQPTAVFGTAAEAIRYCETYPTEAQRFYFRNPNGTPAHAMLFFTSDGGLILGLSVSEEVEEAFTGLKAHARSDLGYITFESPPCERAAEFRELAPYLLMQLRTASGTDSYA